MFQLRNIALLDVFENFRSNQGLVKIRGLYISIAVFILCKIEAVYQSTNPSIYRPRLLH